MSIIITGAGGFVGRRLVQMLLAEGKPVVAIDQFSDGIPEGARSVAGDICSKELRAEALRDGCQAVVHLATVPGAAAEANPAASRKVNIDAMYDLLEEAAIAGACPRFVYASSIAVFGDWLPLDCVDDNTPLSPKMTYGGHKAMMEIAVNMFSNRGAIDGVSLRLPGILARPKGPSGMKSAFMSDMFHALKAGESFSCPVSSFATIWAESLDCVALNLHHALKVDSAILPATRAVTLPALRIAMGDLAAEIARQSGVSPDLVTYGNDAGLEAAFGMHPRLKTPAADQAGFSHDGNIAMLVERALASLD